MKVLLAGGGTAGHINPALAIAGYIKQKRPDTEFLFIGNADGMEQRLVAQAGYPIESIAISGFKRGFAPKDTIENIKTVNVWILEYVPTHDIINTGSQKNNKEIQARPLYRNGRLRFGTRCKGGVKARRDLPYS